MKPLHELCKSWRPDAPPGRAPGRASRRSTRSEAGLGGTGLACLRDSAGGSVPAPVTSPLVSRSDPPEMGLAARQRGGSCQVLWASPPVSRPPGVAPGERHPAGSPRLPGSTLALSARPPVRCSPSGDCPLAGLSLAGLSLAGLALAVLALVADPAVARQSSVSRGAPAAARDAVQPGGSAVGQTGGHLANVADCRDTHGTRPDVADVPARDDAGRRAGDKPMDRLSGPAGRGHSVRTGRSGCPRRPGDQAGSVRPLRPGPCRGRYRT
jgi:hypothetical protein